jgi:NADH-quinone oxidoreductase subunit A
MPDIVGYLLIFTAVGAGFILVNMTVGKLLRPAKMDAEKGTIYECGEPTVGSAWVQFDLRFYVVALLFVIFDVEMAFFFPWAVVFGKANKLADERLPIEQRIVETRAMTGFRTDAKTMEQQERLLQVLATPEEFERAREDWRRVNLEYTERVAQQAPGTPIYNKLVQEQLAHQRIQPTREVLVESARRARELATVAFYDILFFFGVLLVGFAYLWKRGDLNWVRSLAAQREG